MQYKAGKGSCSSVMLTMNTVMALCGHAVVFSAGAIVRNPGAYGVGQMSPMDVMPVILLMLVSAL